MFFGTTGALVTQTYAKPGHRFQLTSWCSRVPYSTFKSVALSGTVRLARACSNEQDFRFHRHLFVNRLYARGIPLRELRNWTQSVSWHEVRKRSFVQKPTQPDFATDDACLHSTVPLHLTLPYDLVTATAVPTNTVAALGKVIGNLEHRLRERHILC